MKTNTSATIYNRIYDERDRSYRYQRTIIQKVFFQERQAYNKLVSGNNSEDRAIVLIPFDISKTREYVPFKEFQQKEHKERYFTLQNEDLIVKGSLDFEILEDNPKMLKEKFDVYTITSVDTFDYGSKNMRHWKVGAK